jgi:hypothetical protein
MDRKSDIEDQVKQDVEHIDHLTPQDFTRNANAKYATHQTLYSC